MLKACSTALERSDANRTAVPRWRRTDLTWQRGKVISNVLNSVSLESLNTLRATRKTSTPPPFSGNFAQLSCQAARHHGTGQIARGKESNARRVKPAGACVGEKSEYCKMKDPAFFLSCFLSFLDTEVFKNREKLLQRPTSKSECSKVASNSAREKWRESDFCTAMTSDYETWQRGKVISNVLNSVSLESLNTLRATREPPHPLPLRELCPTVMPSSPPSRHRPNRSRKGEQCEKSSALSLQGGPQC